MKTRFPKVISGMALATVLACIVPGWERGVISASETIQQSTDSSSLTRTAPSPEPKKPHGTSNSAETPTNTQRSLLSSSSTPPMS